MTIWVYSLMWNERLLLPFYLRHYQQFADRIVIFDHHSTDGSAELARAAGCDVCPFDMPGIHEPSITRLYNTCFYDARGKADWVIIADIDEFIQADNLPGYLDTAAAGGYQAIRCAGYLMLHDAPPVDDGRPLTETHRLGVRDAPFSKVAIIRPDIETNFDHGRHSAHPTGRLLQSEVVKLLHYRYWGVAYIEERNRQHAARLSLENRLHGWGVTKARDDGGYYSASWFEQAKAHRLEVL